MGMHTDFRTFTIPISGTSGTVQLEGWDTFGLLIPTLDSTTLKLQVSQDGSNYFDVKDGGGTQVCNYAAGTGSFAVSTRDMADIAGYKYLAVICGSAQNSAARTFTLCFKAPGRR